MHELGSGATEMGSPSCKSRYVTSFTAAASKSTPLGAVCTSGHSEKFMNRRLAADFLPPILLRALRRVRAGRRPGLNGIDSHLAGYLDVSRTGFFVELGANDGYAQSNTWFLEKEFGWGGGTH